MNAPSDLRTITRRETARSCLARGEPALAEGAYAQLLALAPDDREALLFVVDRCMARGETTQALQWLQAAGATAQADPAVADRLGVAHLAAGDFDQAAASLQRALDAVPDQFVSRLRLGIALEQCGRGREALAAYFMAIQTAQGQGRWLNDATTAPGLREPVKYALRYVNAGRHALFSESLEPLRERYGRAEMQRVEHALAIYLGERPAELADPRQQPKFLYFPGVPSQPYYPRARFPWLDTLEEATATVRDELRQVLQHEPALEPFLGVQSAQQAQAMLRGSGNQEAAWDAYFFYRHGERYDAHCARCPQTTALLDALPLVRISGHAPETLFSVLRPGTHILPHRGVTNTRLVTHLPLIVPADCALRVGGEEHAWQEGRCVVFDDSFEHEAWNRSEQTRVVLIFDTWNPDLSEVERAAVTDLVETIGAFNRACELPPARAAG